MPNVKIQELINDGDGEKERKRDFVYSRMQKAKQ
jgi:hypothetical protein